MRTVAFFSYTRHDDEARDKRLSRIREKLENELRARLGQKDIEVFQDVHDIKVGENWGKRLDEALRGAALLIVIVTPSFFTSEACQKELEKFRARERELGRNDLIIPLYWLKDLALEGKRFESGSARAFVLERQMRDWRSLSGTHVAQEELDRKVESLADELSERLFRMDEKPKPPPVLPQPHQPPDVSQTSVLPPPTPPRPKSLAWLWAGISGLVLGAVALGLVAAVAPQKVGLSYVPAYPDPSVALQEAEQRVKTLETQAALLTDAAKIAKTQAESAVKDAEAKRDEALKRAAAAETGAETVKAERDQAMKEMEGVKKTSGEAISEIQSERDGAIGQAKKCEITLLDAQSEIAYRVRDVAEIDARLQHLLLEKEQASKEIDYLKNELVMTKKKVEDLSKFVIIDVSGEIIPYAVDINEKGFAVNKFRSPILDKAGNPMLGFRPK